jgi:hypothetical protein
MKQVATFIIVEQMQFMPQASGDRCEDAPGSTTDRNWRERQTLKPNQSHFIATAAKGAFP